MYIEGQVVPTKNPGRFLVRPVIPFSISDRIVGSMPEFAQFKMSSDSPAQKPRKSTLVGLFMERERVHLAHGDELDRDSETGWCRLKIHYVLECRFCLRRWAAPAARFRNKVQLWVLPNSGLPTRNDFLIR